MNFFPEIKVFFDEYALRMKIATGKKEKLMLFRIPKAAFKISKRCGIVNSRLFNVGRLKH